MTREYSPWVLMVPAFVLGAVYYIGCLLGYAQEGSLWLVAALIVPPLDIAYPLAAVAFDEPVPWGLIFVGAGALILGVLGAILEER